MRSEKAFVDINKKDHINSILNKIFKSAKPLQVWQKEEPLRQKANGVLKSLQLSQNYIELESTEVNGFLDFKNDEIFFYSEYRTTIFKSKIKYKNNGRTIVIEYPEMVKIEEARTQPRTRYGISTEHRIEALFEYNDGKKVIQNDVRVLDSSDDGCAILISKHFGQNLVVGGKVVVMNSSVEGLKKRAGLIRSITLFKNTLTGESCFRLGVQLLTR
ncbi:hypothetical protein [Bacteriovorax sp. Seq25_V]|uniref:hypothetical protein n=1 Tax=Bacteriovorax sp. Seq25_V TaxID=1201288 RepID=UPI00038A06DF|nr:hypothetical protein [Bacteriovorax sp. Seq25_V]EQC47749.1 hypothetical protein M900_A0203 [Bacteriovorax sp. Seq25_V]